jgi:hypothetical protein
LGKIWLIVYVAGVIAQTMAFYGFLSNLISKREYALRTIGLYIGANIGLLSVYSWCSEAQKVEECVSMICILLTAFCGNILATN